MCEQAGQSLGKRQARLTLAAHQAGWLGSTIDHGNADKGRTNETRAEKYRGAGKEPPFLDVGAGVYLLHMLMEAGPVKSAPVGGAVALDWVDLHAYISLTVGSVEDWEASLLRRMSLAYANGLQEGANPFSIAPADREMKG